MRELPKLIVSLICSISIYSQQTPAPRETRHHRAAPAHVVTIRFVTGAGLCGCYCGGELRVSAGQAMLLITPFSDCQRQNPAKYREFRVNADLSTKHWHELEELVNHDALFGLPDKIGCPGCTDGGTEFIEVEFSDRTKKSVYYENAPTDIRALSDKLNALDAKLRSDLPPNFPKE
jgi:hypothetical protein